jgi:hypothetical protein
MLFNKFVFDIDGETIPHFTKIPTNTHFTKKLRAKNLFNG